MSAAHGSGDEPLSGERVIAAGGLESAYWLTSSWLHRNGERVPIRFGTFDAASPLGENRWLTADRATLRVHERPADAGRVLQALPSACNVQLIEARAGAWVVWLSSPSGCSGRDARGPVHAMKVLPSGATSTVRMPFGESPMAQLRARLDAGRLVIEARVSQSSDSATIVVLDSDGGTPVTSVARTALCPLSGCVTLTIGGQDVGFTPVGGRESSWRLSGVGGSFLTSAVRGDLALLALRDPAGSSLSLAVVDFRQRRVERVFDVRNGTQGVAVDVWHDFINADNLRLASSDRGFIYAGASPTGRLTAFDVDCAP